MKQSKLLSKPTNRSSPIYLQSRLPIIQLPSIIGSTSNRHGLIGRFVASIACVHVETLTGRVVYFWGTASACASHRLIVRLYCTVGRPERVERNRRETPVKQWLEQAHNEALSSHKRIYQKVMPN